MVVTVVVAAVGAAGVRGLAAVVATTHIMLPMALWSRISVFLIFNERTDGQTD